MVAARHGAQARGQPRRVGGRERRTDGQYKGVHNKKTARPARTHRPQVDWSGRP
jgi:hypothetical protein